MFISSNLILSACAVDPDVKASVFVICLVCCQHVSETLQVCFVIEKFVNGCSFMTRGAEQIIPAFVQNILEFASLSL